MADLATLRSWLDDAEAALHKVTTGRQTVTVPTETGPVEYAVAKVPELRAYIQDLKARIAQAEGRPGRRFFSPGFGR